MTEQAELDGLTDFIKNRHSDLNILINNAGIQYNHEFLTEPNLLDKIEYEISANLTAVIKLCALLLPVLAGNENSAIVNVSNGLALSPKRSAPVYCATKAAIHNFTRPLRYQMEEQNPKIFEILPPLVETPMTAGRGKNKISPERLAEEFIRDFKNDRYESCIGKTKLLKFIKRFSPALGDATLKNG